MRKKQKCRKTVADVIADIRAWANEIERVSPKVPSIAAAKLRDIANDLENTTKSQPTNKEQA